MTGRVLVDAGPLVALVSTREEHHQSCAQQARKLAPPLFTCWPVITEACWLLRYEPVGVQELLRGFDTGMFRALDLDERAPAWIADFLRRYENIGAQVADAALVYLAEREGIDTIFTLDRRDFSIYRLKSGLSLRLLPAR
ncbi:MAG: PIN domain-containing protein [Acidobacteria bacterium]|nr:PIN domain-containing protein [Acidobacteriota bacterium]